MDTDELEQLLLRLPDADRWQLFVHPSRIRQATIATINAGKAGQVLVAENLYLDPDDIALQGTDNKEAV